MIDIKETIVVEGKDDETAVRAAVNANIICTHGFGIRPEAMELISKAYEQTGIIIFTDPDHAGETIRERLTKAFPAAKQAFLTKGQATRADDIGIENANADDIVNALKAASAIEEGHKDTFTSDDLFLLGLVGFDNSSKRREEVGAKLGIGCANGSTFLRRLNYMNITREELEKACK